MKRWAWAVGPPLTQAGGGRADEAEVVKAIEKVGGKVGRDGTAPGRPVTVVGLKRGLRAPSR